jgi:hypothetical protein
MSYYQPARGSCFYKASQKADVLFHIYYQLKPSLRLKRQALFTGRDKSGSMSG